MPLRFPLLATAVAACLLGAPAAGLSAEPDQAAAGVLALLPEPATTRHSIVVDGRALAYEAEAGTLALLGGGGETTAEIFYVAYRVPQSNAAAAEARPITFVFNGGPGAASAYLHLGGLGPRVLRTQADGRFRPPPQILDDNPDTWLDRTDLVFVDPVGTGYSRAAPGAEERSFFGVEADAASMGAFVRLFLQKAERLSSPLFLAGESYGGFRAALLAKTLQADIGLEPRGVVLISPALEISFVRGDDLQPLTFALPLPSMAAIRLAQEGVSGEALRRRLEPVERYALTDYLAALASGWDAGRDTASGRVAELTGLPLELVRKNAARIPPELFAKQAAPVPGEALSLYDGAVAAPDLAPGSERPSGPDGVLDRSVPVLTSTFVSYARDELGFRTPISYRLLNGEISRQWDYGPRRERDGVLDDLQEARALNPNLSVLIVNGYADLVTPYMVSRYLVGQLPALSAARPIRTLVYDGGHMMYFRPSSRTALKRDAAALFEAAAGGSTGG